MTTFLLFCGCVIVGIITLWFVLGLLAVVCAVLGELLP